MPSYAQRERNHLSRSDIRSRGVNPRTCQIVRHDNRQRHPGITSRRSDWCPLCGTPKSCEARIASPFRDAEYDIPAMRLAVHQAARDLGWAALKFRGKLTDELAHANVHFSNSYMPNDVFDLDLSPIEDERDGYEIDAGEERDAVGRWIGDYLLKEFTEDTLPKFRSIGRSRFHCIASAIIAIRPALEERLIEIANDLNPSPPED